MLNLVVLRQTLTAFTRGSPLWSPGDDRGAADGLKAHPSLLGLSCQVGHTVGQTVRAYAWRFAGKIEPLASCILRSLKVVESDPGRCDFLLVIYRVHLLITFSDINGPVGPVYFDSRITPYRLFLLCFTAGCVETKWFKFESWSPVYGSTLPTSTASQ